MNTLLSTIARTLAGALGLFTLTNLVGGMLRPGFDANLWWIDLRQWPGALAVMFLLSLGLAASLYAVRPMMPPMRRRFTALMLAVALATTLTNVVTYHRLVSRGWIDAASPVSVSLFASVMLLFVLIVMWRTKSPAQTPALRRPLAAMTASITLTALALLFPLAQIYCFGTTSYARQADVIIVPGARAYADGSPSLPLADRVRTACELHRRGYAPVLLFSGGPGDGDIHETQAMRRYALSLGVPDHAILLDPQGVSTQATADHTIPMLDRIDARRILVVSHFYHLPRLKLAYQRQGREVYTVPAVESRTLRAMPAYLLREVAALWWYYVKPAIG